MTADIVALLVEIRRSGGDVRLVGRNRLKLVAPTALLPVLVERVRAAKPMLLAALADPASQVNIAQESGGGVSNPRRNSAAVQHPTAASTSDRADPTPTIKWRARQREALAYWSVHHPAPEAARLAWGELECRWHWLYGERTPEWQCAGCGPGATRYRPCAMTAEILCLWRRRASEARGGGSPRVFIKRRSAMAGPRIGPSQIWARMLRVMHKRRQSACGASGNGDAMGWSISESSCASLRLSVSLPLAI